LIRSLARANTGGNMKKLLVVTALLALAAGCKKKPSEDKAPPPAPGSAAAGSGSAVAEQPPAGDPKAIERGKYIANAGGCLVCHTAIGPNGPDLAHPGAGGLEMPDPIGTWRTPNISPDKGTGIGNWSDDQIIAAVREGIRPDGQKLFAIMPYMNYNVMSNDDAKALVAFLRTLPPTERTVAPNKDLKIPKMDAPKPAGTEPADKGAYLTSIMLCNHCHWTPKKDMSGPVDMNHMYSGGMPLEFPPMGTGMLFTPNITSDADTGIGKWTEEQIFTTIKTMVRPNGKPIMGPMQFLQGGWSQMTDDDLKLVAAFVKKLPPVKNKVPPSGAGGGSGAAPAAGSAAGSAAPAAGSAK
jgi:hypothetical protein